MIKTEHGRAYFKVEGSHGNDQNRTRQSVYQSGGNRGMMRRAAHESEQGSYSYDRITRQAAYQRARHKATIETGHDKTRQEENVTMREIQIVK